MTGTVLSIQDLEIHVREASIVSSLSFTLERGEGLALVGESGSGKSMTLRAVLGLLPSEARMAGRIEVDGVCTDSLSIRQRRRQVAANIGVVFQDPRAHINPIRTIGDFLAEQLLLLRGVNRRVACDRAIAALNDVGISDGAERMNQYPHELSGGLLQRVLIASVLLAEPRIILADEPTTALDVSTQEEVVAILNEQRMERELAMVFVSHDLDLACAITDRTVVMKAGEVVEIAPSRTLHRTAKNPYTRELFAARPSLTDPGAFLREFGKKQNSATTSAGETHIE